MENWERMLVGTIINDPPSIYEVGDVTAGDFLSPHLQEVWKHIILLASREALTEQTLVESLRDAKELDGLGEEKVRGADYIMFLSSIGDTAGLTEYALQVRDASTKRRLVNYGRLLVEQATNGQKAEEIIDDHLKRIIKLQRIGRDPQPLWMDVPAFEQKQLDMIEGRAKPFWHPNIAAIRTVLKHMLSSDFQIVAGIPGTGKTAYLIHEGIETAIKQGPTLLYSFENTREESLIRVVAHLSQVGMEKIFNPKLRNKKDTENIKNAVEDLKNFPFFVEELSFATAVDIINITRKMTLQHDLKLVMVDGMYLMAGDTDSKYETISENTQKLRSLAMDLHLPLIASTQFNRSVNQAKAQQSDLLYAGENAARQVLSIVKQTLSAQQAAKFPENWEKGKFNPTGGDLTAEVVRFDVLKNTNGKTGKTPEVKWDKATNTFLTLQEDWRKLTGNEKMPVHRRKLEYNYV